MATVKQTLQEIKDDIPGNKLRLTSFITSYLFSASFRILLNHRLGKYFYQSRNIVFKQLSRRYRYRLNTRRNCDISYKAIIGKHLILPHPIGVVIGDGVVIKDNVMVFQQVTFGSHGKKGDEMSYPVIENNVRIYAGARIIGGVTIGENSVIGANSVVNKNVPPNCIAYGVPCKIKEQ